MLRHLMIVLVAFLASGLRLVAVAETVQRPRLAVLTDIGGDPDDQQSMIRLMMYSNEFDIEALIATASGTPGELKVAVTRPDLILQIIDAYEKVLPNLRKHAQGWPEAETLRKCVKSGNPQRGLKNIGEGTTARAPGISSNESMLVAQNARSISPFGVAKAIWRRLCGG